MQLPVSRTTTKQSAVSNRRASLPLTRTTVQESPCRAITDIFDSFGSPNVSVNAPRIDKMIELPLASNEDSYIRRRRTSLTSAQGSTTSPQGDHLTMKDKCIVSDETSARLSVADALHGSSECSDQDATAGASSKTSSDQRQHRFDTSSHQQRAEALEGLLEFSARLLNEARFDELGVLLKPFGPGKVSPRETAIWLAKSFKENTAHQEDQYQ